MKHTNGGRLALTPEAAEERLRQLAEKRAHAQAVGAFKGIVSQGAMRIAAGRLAGCGCDQAMDPDEADKFAQECVDLARKIAIRANACQFPTAEELGHEPDETDETEAETDSQEG